MVKSGDEFELSGGDFEFDPELLAELIPDGEELTFSLGMFYNQDLAPDGTFWRYN